MNVTRKIFGSLAITTLLALSGNVARADEPVHQINAANQALEEGNFDEALKQYDMAEEMMPGSPLLAYNRGVAQYRMGQVDQARHLFTTALDTEDPELAAKATFNLGNCDYAVAVQQSETDRVAAIASLKTAIAHYRSALQTNPADTDSRSNIELASQLMQKLQQHEEQEQQQQEQQQQDQQQQNKQQNDDQDSKDQKSDESQQDQNDQSDSLDEKSDEEESDDSKSEENQSDQQKDSEQESDESKSDESESDQSKSDATKSGQPNDEQESDEQESTESNREETNEERKEQQDSPSSEAQEPKQQSELQNDQQPDPQPSDEHHEQQPEQQPEQQMQVGQPGEQDQQADGQQTPGYAVSQQGESGENIDEQEAMKMLQAIRDRDLMRRMKKLDETRRRHRPVDRDW